MTVGNPFAPHVLIRPWNHREMSIPKTGMMGTGVANNGQCGEPALKTFVLRDIKAASHLFLHGVVVHVLVELG